MTDTDRLRRLLLMLSSPYDAEITTAARAVGSLLKKEGSDWPDLVDRLTGTAKVQPAPKPERQAWNDFEAAEIAERLLAVGVGELGEWEFDFLQSMTCWDGPATGRQDAVLRRIAAKLGWTP